MAHNEVYLRCAQLANASRVLGNLGDDILSKITLGTIVETGSDDGHFMALRGPVTLRHMRFRLTDQFSVALQQQRLQVVTGVRPAEPPEHPRLVATSCFYTSTLAPVVSRS